MTKCSDMAATAGNKLAGKFCGTDHRRALRKEPKVLAGKLDSINLIESSGFRMIIADDLDDAAAKAVRISDIVKQAEEIQIGVSFELPL